MGPACRIRSHLLWVLLDYQGYGGENIGGFAKVLSGVALCDPKEVVHMGRGSGQCLCVALPQMCDDVAVLLDASDVVTLRFSQDTPFAHLVDEVLKSCCRVEPS